jgi:MFS family permease
MLLLFRVGIGMTQALFVVYAPVWVDDFAGDGNAATWMAILQGSMPLGVMIGYTTAGFLVNSVGYTGVILIQVIMLGPPTIGIFFMPKKYLEVDYISKEQLEKERASLALANLKSPEEGAADAATTNPLSEVASESGSKSNNTSADATVGNDGIVAKNNSDAAKTLSRHESMSEHEPFLRSMYTLLTSGVFVCATLGLSTLYFVVTGIQFWATEFLIQVVGAPINTVLGAFAGTSATAPVLGVVVGGILIDKIGGYNGVVGAQKTTRICAAFAVLATGSALLAATMTSFLAVLMMVWLVLFFGGAIVPGATGLVLSSVPSKLRVVSSGFSIFVFNICGYMAGTMVPAMYMEWLVSEGTPYKEAVHSGWILLLCWSIWALVMFGISAIITTFGICGFSLVESAEDGHSSQEDSQELAVSPSGKQIAI